MPKYVIEAPFISTNLSESCPALTTFEAPDDKKAIEFCELNRSYLNTYRHKSSVFLSGGTNWLAVARCRRAGEHEIIWPAHKVLKSVFA